MTDYIDGMPPALEAKIKGRYKDMFFFAVAPFEDGQPQLSAVFAMANAYNTPTGGATAFSLAYLQDKKNWKNTPVVVKREIQRGISALLNANMPKETGWRTKEEVWRMATTAYDFHNH